ncbi:hypothetical protein GCM10010384_39920 [Streptomyces djakartensis]|uniref:MFS transporter n=1 Tax=Streptomyces djakartensis TaxID=68193 RepID=A0ABQ3A114_9ACTN|nr:hypothetical protein GCM10010384_39920 [Streptomyces djakartensis]
MTMTRMVSPPEIASSRRTVPPADFITPQSRRRPWAAIAMLSATAITLQPTAITISIMARLSVSLASVS